MTEQDDYFGANPWEYGKLPHTTNNGIEWYLNSYFTYYLKQHGLPNCRMWRIRDTVKNETWWLCTEHKKHGGGHIVFESPNGVEGLAARIDFEVLNRKMK